MVGLEEEAAFRHFLDRLELGGARPNQQVTHLAFNSTRNAFVRRALPGEGARRRRSVSTTADASERVRVALAGRAATREDLARPW